MISTAAILAIPACAALGPFYWEVGDVHGVTASGRVGTLYSADTQMPIASASKWLYAAAITKRNGVTDVPMLNFTSGYGDFNLCLPYETVGHCADRTATFEPATVGKFNYGGGHMAQHATRNGLSAMRPAELARAVSLTLGIPVDYSNAMVSGAAQTTPRSYGRFLRKTMAGDYPLPLGANSVCADSSCAVYTPFGDAGTRYSLGHWVEPDGTFSSAGAFGFYPWISADRTKYGIIARVDKSGRAGYASMLCGREIRKAMR